MKKKPAPEPVTHKGITLTPQKTGHGYIVSFRLNDKQCITSRYQFEGEAYGEARKRIDAAQPDAPKVPTRTRR